MAQPKAPPLALLSDEACWELLLQFRALHRVQDHAAMQRLHAELGPLRRVPAHAPNGAVRPAAHGSSACELKPPAPPPFPELPVCARPGTGADAMVVELTEKLLPWNKKQHEDDAESVGARTQAEPEGDDTADATTVCGDTEDTPSVWDGAAMSEASGPSGAASRASGPGKPRAESARPWEHGDGALDDRARTGSARRRRKLGVACEGPGAWTPTLTLLGTEHANEWRLPTPPGRATLPWPAEPAGASLPAPPAPRSASEPQSTQSRKAKKKEKASRSVAAPPGLSVDLSVQGYQPSVPRPAQAPAKEPARPAQAQAKEQPRPAQALAKEPPCPAPAPAKEPPRPAAKEKKARKAKVPALSSPTEAVGGAAVSVPGLPDERAAPQDGAAPSWTYTYLFGEGASP